MVQLSKEFVEAFNAIGANRNKLKPNELYQSCMDCMRNHKVVYKDVLHCRLFLVHPKNRGGLMLSPYNVHRNQLKIHNVGADIRSITNAVAIEMAHEGKLREEQLASNKSLIDRVAGLLASICGEERYLSVGAGHTVAGCKNAYFGGRTPHKELQAENGLTDLGKLKRNAQMAQMIESGWEWEVVPHEVDRDFPWFAACAQRALNTQNHVATTVSELETALALFDISEDPGMQSQENWKELALTNIKELGYPCAQYAAPILEFVTLYAGGPGAPYIKMIDNVVKQYRCTCNLGETFWTALSNTTFFDKTSKYPLLRMALAIANLTSDKVLDGVARLLSKADVAKIASKKEASKASIYEKTLVDSLQIVEQLSTVDICLGPLGKIFSRIGLLAAEKTRFGPEGKQLSLLETRQLFLQDVGRILGETVEFPEWKASANSNSK